jgi:hypothetical protein
MAWGNSWISICVCGSMTPVQAKADLGNLEKEKKDLDKIDNI